MARRNLGFIKPGDALTILTVLGARAAQAPMILQIAIRCESGAGRVRKAEGAMEILVIIVKMNVDKEDVPEAGGKGKEVYRWGGCYILPWTLG